MTPEQLAAVNAEHSHQRALFAWANMAERVGFENAWVDRSYIGCLDYSAHTVPELRWLHAIPNGGYRDKVTASKLKVEGVKRGVSDIFLPVPMPDRSYCGLYVEMKRPKTMKAGKRKAEVVAQSAGELKPEQDEFVAYARHMGYAVAVCFSWDQAAKQIQSYIEEVRRKNERI